MSLKLDVTVTDESKHENDVGCLLYSNNHLLSGADDGKVKIWTVDLKLVGEIKAHPANVYSVAVLNDTIYTCASDGTLKSWNWGTWDLKKILMEKQDPETEIIKVCADQGKVYAANDKGDLFVFENDNHVATYNLHEDIADILVIGHLVFNARNVDISVTEMMPAPRFSYMSRGAIIGRFPIRKVGDKVCFLSRCAKQIYVHLSTKEDKFKRLATLKEEEPPKKNKYFKTATNLHLNAHDMTISALAELRGKDHIMVSGGYDRILKAWDLNTKKKIAQIDTGVCINDIVAGEEGILYLSSGEGFIARVLANF